MSGVWCPMDRPPIHRRAVWLLVRGGVIRGWRCIGGKGLESCYVSGGLVSKPVSPTAWTPIIHGEYPWGCFPEAAE